MNKCEICGSEFLPDKRHISSKTCGPKCSSKRNYITHKNNRIASIKEIGKKLPGDIYEIVVLILTVIFVVWLFLPFLVVISFLYGVSFFITGYIL